VQLVKIAAHAGKIDNIRLGDGPTTAENSIADDKIFEI